MASRRATALALLAARDLAPQQLALERARAARDLQNQAAGLGALEALAQGSVKGLETGAKVWDATSTREGERFAKTLKGHLGDVVTDSERKPTNTYGLDPLHEAERLALEDPAYKPEEGSSIPGNPLHDFFRNYDPRLAWKRDARRKATLLGAEQIADARELAKKQRLHDEEKAREAAQREKFHTEDVGLKERSIEENARLREATLGLQGLIAGTNAGIAKETLRAKVDEDLRRDEREREEAKARAAEAAARAAEVKAGREQAQRQHEDRIQLQRDRIAAIEARAREAKENKGLTPPQQEERASRLALLEQIKELEDLKKRVTTGMVGSRKEKLKKFFLSNTDWTTFRLQTTAVQRAIAKNIEGGRLTDSDARAYESVVLNPDDMDDQEFEANLALAKKTAERSLRLFDDEAKRARPSLEGTLGTPGAGPRELDPDDADQWQ